MGKYSPYDIFIYRPIKLTTDELHNVNRLIMGNTREWVGFNDISAVKPSFYHVRGRLPKGLEDPLKELYPVFEHGDDEVYLRSMDRKTIFSEFKESDFPESFRFMFRKRIGLPFLMD